MCEKDPTIDLDLSENPMNDAVVLTVDGAVDKPLRLTYADLEALPQSDQVHDVSRFHPSRRGDGVLLEAILHRAGVKPQANYLTLHADRDDFHVSIPLAPVRAEGIVVYRNGADCLNVDQGGPIRFLIRDPSACHTGELDECANVKFLCRIELTERRGRDTRPADEGAHAALHAAQ
jgi:DMSO/TMAO reductase YedYZ molybdopterin-dependent catalytic subunit